MHSELVTSGPDRAHRSAPAVQRAADPDLSSSPTAETATPPLPGLATIRRAPSAAPAGPAVAISPEAAAQLALKLGMDPSEILKRSPEEQQVLQAQAYAQGNDIHLAPGAERHLPHEAWHVVQQAQGRVQPTAQL